MESVSSESELSFSMVKRDESTAEFRLASMQLLPMLMNCSGDSCSRSLAVQTLAVDEDEILYPTKNFSKEDILTLKATYCMLVEKDVLRKLILSNDIRDMIGFSSEWKKDGPAADLQQERFFELYTSDPDWFISSKDHVKVDSSSEGGKARTIAVGVKDNTIEDGEEEDGDEEHTMETQVSSHIHFEESSNNDMNVDFPTKLSMTFNEVPFPLTISALDCEMCATEAGLELTRITIVSPIYGLILDTLVSDDIDISVISSSLILLCRLNPIEILSTI